MDSGHGESIQIKPCIWSHVHSFDFFAPIWSIFLLLHQVVTHIFPIKQVHDIKLLDIMVANLQSHNYAQKNERDKTKQSATHRQRVKLQLQLTYMSDVHKHTQCQSSVQSACMDLHTMDVDIYIKCSQRAPPLRCTFTKELCGKIHMCSCMAFDICVCLALSSSRNTHILVLNCHLGRAWKPKKMLCNENGSKRL